MKLKENRSVLNPCMIAVKLSHILVNTQPYSEPESNASLKSKPDQINKLWHVCLSDVQMLRIPEVESESGFQGTTKKCSYQLKRQAMYVMSTNSTFPHLLKLLWQQVITQVSHIHTHMLGCHWFFTGSKKKSEKKKKKKNFYKLLVKWNERHTGIVPGCYFELWVIAHQLLLHWRTT